MKAQGGRAWLIHAAHAGKGISFKEGRKGTQRGHKGKKEQGPLPAPLPDIFWHALTISAGGGCTRLAAAGGRLLLLLLLLHGLDGLRRGAIGEQVVICKRRPASCRLFVYCSGYLGVQTKSQSTLEGDAQTAKRCNDGGTPQSASVAHKSNLIHCFSHLYPSYMALWSRMDDCWRTVDVHLAAFSLSRHRWLVGRLKVDKCPRHILNQEFEKSPVLPFHPPLIWSDP